LLSTSVVTSINISITIIVLTVHSTFSCTSTTVWL
jgi:hypothetical protein